MEDDIVARIGFKSGVVEISEDVLCKHTIFIGSTGSSRRGGALLAALRKRITCVLEYVLFKYDTPCFENCLNEIFNLLNRTNELLYEIGRFELAIEDIRSKIRKYRIEYENLRRRLERLRGVFLEWQSLETVQSQMRLAPYPTC